MHHADTKITFSDAASGAFSLQQKMPDAEANGYFDVIFDD